jgi:hypothetical protein
MRRELLERVGAVRMDRDRGHEQVGMLLRERHGVRVRRVERGALRVRLSVVPVEVVEGEQVDADRRRAAARLRDQALAVLLVGAGHVLDPGAAEVEPGACAVHRLQGVEHARVHVGAAARGAGPDQVHVEVLDAPRHVGERGAEQRGCAGAHLALERVGRSGEVPAHARQHGDRGEREHDEGEAQGEREAAHRVTGSSGAEGCPA